MITKPHFPRLSELWRFATGGIVHVALYTVLLNLGERTVSAGPASFIINVNPIITALLAIAILQERFGKWAWIGTFLVLHRHRTHRAGRRLGDEDRHRRGADSGALRCANR